MIEGFRERLHSGETLFGPMLSIPSAAVAEVLAAAGFDWLFIDGEHGAIDSADLVPILQAVDRDLACLVRIAELGVGVIKRTLDLGAAGIIVPQVETAEQAAAAVRYARYAPDGERGIGLARAHRYGFGFREYLERANQEIAVVVQAEHARAVENIDSIVAVEGLDAVFVGPYDLSASFGQAGNLDHPTVVQAIDHITASCQAAGVPLGIFGIDAKSVKPFIERGYVLICAGVDCVMLGQGASGMLKELRS